MNPYGTIIDRPRLWRSDGRWYCAVPPPDPKNSFTVGECGSGSTPRSAYDVWFMIRYPPDLAERAYMKAAPQKYTKRDRALWAAEQCGTWTP